MKVAIVGAGVAGIVSLKYALEAGFECDCFEETESFGGTWVYTEKTGNYEYDFPIYRTMYKDLVTNLPKEVMTFLDFPYPPDVTESFITQTQVLQYITDYVNSFRLEKHIQYYKSVVKVQPEDGGKWTVTTRNVKTKIETSEVYDFIFICNGHFRFPRIPNVAGRDLYTGLQVHSGDYRTPDLYKDKRVLVIGGAFSGIDICKHIKDVAKNITMSHWSQTLQINKIIQKPAIEKLYETGAIFTDGTKEDFDVIVFCTGYEYKYPFLTNECGISVEDNWVQPLHKHCINIKYPSMFFIGVPFFVPVFVTCDIQARFAIAIIEKKVTLPSKKKMLTELEHYIASLKKENIAQRHTHKISTGLKDYLMDLEKTASLKPTAPVISNIYTHLIKNLSTEQKVTKFVLVDDENFLQIL